MNIQSIQYTDDTQQSLRVATDTGEMIIPWPCKTWHNEPIQTWLGAGNEIADAPAPSLSDLKASKIVEINAAYEAAAKSLVRDYPETERLSWQQQLNEAQRYQEWANADKEGAGPLMPVLGSILRGRNGDDGTETIADLVAAVLARADAFVRWQTYTGIRHRGERLIQKAETVPDVRAVTWESLTGETT